MLIFGQGCFLFPDFCLFLQSQRLDVLLPEYECDRRDEQHKREKMVPLEVERAKQHARHYGKDYQRQCFLNHFQLYEAEGAAVVCKTDAVGGHLAAILKECYQPAQKYHSVERQVGILRYLRETEVSVPRKCHECIAHDKQQNRKNTFL